MYVYWILMSDQEIVRWLLKGDVSIQYQVYRDLLDEERPDLQERIETEGWGYKILGLRNENGHWGSGYYQPKWTSSHYTVLELKNMGIRKDCRSIRQTLEVIIKTQKGLDGGINPGSTINCSDVCVNGMALNFLSYFGCKEKDLESMVDFLLSQQMADGGFNCYSNRSGARHSSLHTSLSVLEGIQEYGESGYVYRKEELTKTAEASREFILEHRLFKSDKTGKIIRNRFLALSYPGRWRYDILRALDHFWAAKTNFDPRMSDSMEVLINKRRKDRRWNLQAHHPGKRHFEMETAGQPSRWNTLRAMRVLKHFNK
jgi:hypothetical protein